MWDCMCIYLFVGKDSAFVTHSQTTFPLPPPHGRMSISHPIKCKIMMSENKPKYLWSIITLTHLAFLFSLFHTY